MADPHVVDAWLANQQLERMENYLQRGRSLVDVPIDELRTRWTALMRLWAQEMKGLDHHEREDIEAEMQFRKQEPPFDEVKDVFETLRRNFRKADEELLGDPLRMARLEKRINDQIAQFKAATAKGKRN